MVNFFGGLTYANTIYNIVIVIQRHLQDECKWPVSIGSALMDIYFFAKMNDAMKERTAEEIGIDKHTLKNSLLMNKL